ncbi:preprotein translocase subunit TatA [Gammaproteobacteria bacterium]|jgi:genome maintenance exonuclease 1|nr:preprotein translocase subunit TatA [Gammaproteobacteria bacterium]MDA8733406.1 preprotein translocase subunit TatA [Gammaproteobacteria bacterium]MDC0467259.1 preprotein translocase subunit TatA [Gammaproteobacteria bacterium]MDC0962176.1 preprotein translocase subunit TatA [Gammaproteobacteria bacterium]MDC1007472.1 preprotein translocase subunit TatA [Gammaproteobacteria bacterium]
MTTKNFNKYTYPSLERVDLEIGRHYLDSKNTPVPSVTTVLSATSKSKDGIAQWRNRVGEAEADRIVKQSTDIGSSVHDAIEKYLKDELWDIFENTENELIAKKITHKFVNDGLKKITEIWGLEVGLVLDNLYAGTADCIGEYNSIPTLIDFKTAKKIKKREWIEDYFLQGCAYANAHNVMFGSDIQQIVILMVDRDLIFQEFIVRPTEFKILTNKWKRRLIDFNNKYNS